MVDDARAHPRQVSRRMMGGQGAGGLEWRVMDAEAVVVAESVGRDTRDDGGSTGYRPGETRRTACAPLTVTRWAKSRAIYRYLTLKVQFYLARAKYCSI
jgi:hypothetical protein